MWTKFYNRFGNLNRSTNLERCLAAMMNHQPIRRLEPDLELIRREFWKGPHTYPWLFALFHEQYAQRMGKRRWGDQLAFIERYADQIFEAFPDARMIHMVRHPRGRFETVGMNARHHTGKFGWELARWLFSVRLGQQNQQRFPDRYRIVKYETLLWQGEETMREICAFIGEDFFPGMLTMQGAMRFGNERADESTEKPDLEEEKLAPPRQMSKQEIIYLQTYARKEMLDLHYAEDPILLSSQDILKLCAVDWPANLIGALLWNTVKNG
jgi:hypothetical protein